MIFATTIANRLARHFKRRFIIEIEHGSANSGVTLWSRKPDDRWFFLTHPAHGNAFAIEFNHS